jgi:RNA polymerase sigma factor (sigma-70 family)
MKNTPMNDDAELLRRYAEEGAEAAFAEWVRGHLGLVYAAALRRLGGDTHGAAEVAQRVFIAAAREARGLARHGSVTGWLYTTTRNAAHNLRREEARRRQREQVVARQDFDGVEEAREWSGLKPVLDAAMDDLGEKDREAVLLRFFEGRSFAEVGVRLAVSENTARMRVERALGKLQVRLARRGVTSTAVALGGVLVTQAGAAGTAVPLGLAGSVTQAALAGATAVGGSAALGLGWLGFMSSTKLVVTVGAVLVVGALLGTATWEYRRAEFARQDVVAERKKVAAINAQLQATQQATVVAKRAAAEQEGKFSAARTARAAAPKAGSASGVQENKAENWNPVAEGHAMMARHPELKHAVTARSDAIIRFGFEPMFRELGLTAEQAEAFCRVLGRTSTLGAQVGAQGRMVTFMAGADASLGELNAEMPKILGEENMARLSEYFRRRDARTLAAQWASAVALSDTPASGVQAQALVQLMMETAMPPGSSKVGKFDWEMIMARAPALLSAPQVQALGAVRVAAQRTAASTQTTGGGK